MTFEYKQASPETLATLEALRRTVKNALDRKRRLGEYAVVWRDGKPALLDEDVEDRAAFYEALKKEPGYKSSSEAAPNPLSGVAEGKGQCRSDAD